MIQAPLPKPIETKAPRESQVSSAKVSNSRAKTEEKNLSKSERSEFAKELEGNLKEGEVKVEGKAKAETKTEAKSDAKAETQSAEQVQQQQTAELSAALGLSQESVETTSPKVFDPSVTKDVQELIAPTTTEAQPVKALTDAQVLQLAERNIEVPVLPEETLKAEFAKSLEAAPKFADASGRAPAIDFGKAEVDPQLMNNEDFVAQKNLAAKKVVANPYGMKQLPEAQKVAIENGLKQTQVVKEAASESSPMNSQQFILNLSQENTNSQKVNDVQAPVKTFDMNHIKSSNPTEIMNQITDYAVQAKAAKEPTVNMRVKHDDLGMIDIAVSKVAQGQDAIAINIGTHSADGKAFFQQNSKDLFSHLTNAGLNVSDLKVETPAQTAKSDFDFGSQSGKEQQGSQKQFGSEQNQRRHDSDRRQDLWKLLNKEAA